MNESMLDRLKTMENRYEELGHMLMDPDIGSDIKKMTEVTKEQSSLQAAYDLYQEYKEVEAGISDAKELAKESDPEIKEMAKMELAELETRLPEIISKLEIELIPKDPNDNKDVIMEIRGAAGGDGPVCDCSVRHRCGYQRGKHGKHSHCTDVHGGRQLPAQMQTELHHGNQTSVDPGR